MTFFNLKKIVNNAIRNVSVNYQNSIFLEGAFKISNSSNEYIALYTETQDYRHLFLVNGLDNRLLKTIQKINTLYYMKNGLVLNDHIFLGVKGNITDPMIQDAQRLSNKKNMDTYIQANRLVYVWIPRNNPKYDKFSTKELIANAGRIDFLMHEGDCEQGGEGSTGCSATSNSGAGCSVSCGSGHYACCNETAIGPNDCHCHKS